jgi:hypothetical protein
VDEVVAARLQLVFEDVVPADFEVGQPEPAEEAGVEVGRHDVPLRTDAPRQPAGDGAIAGAHLEATPARPDTQGGEAAGGDRVGELCQEVQPLAFEGVGGVLGEIAVLLHIYS